jgi:hypothetical protein
VGFLTVTYESWESGMEFCEYENSSAGVFKDGEVDNNNGGSGRA